MKPAPSATSQTQQNQSLDERRAALRRLLGSYRANLDAARDNAGKRQKELEHERHGIVEQILALEDRAYLDDNDRKTYADLTRKLVECDKLAVVAGEVFDRADLAIPVPQDEI
jgi:hypothetical protein